MIYVKINNNNVVIDAKETDQDGYIMLDEYSWPFDIYNSRNEYCYKLVDNNIELRTDNEIQMDYETFIEPYEEQSVSIEQRVANLEECMDVLLNGI